MYNCKSIVLCLALTAASVSALPHNGHSRRTTCHRNIANAVSSLIQSSAAAETAAATLAAVPSSSNAAAPTAVVSSAPVSSSKAVSEDTTSTKAASSTKAVASSSKPTGTSSSDDAQPTVGGAKGGLLKSLFPLGTAASSWSTSSGSDGAVSLSDATFKPTKMISALSHTYVTKEGKQAMKAHYPKGSYTFTHSPQGGVSFYAPGPVDLTDAKEVTFGYSVYFPEGFDFNLGGKLPGIYGGNNEDVAISCSGGRRSTECFSARLMWREQGAGEMYTYLPDGFAANDKVCTVAPKSDCNPTYGASIARGSYTWQTGAWNTVSERVKLNTPGQSDGELQLFVDGKSVLNVSGLVLRDSSAGRIRGIQMQTFFGGSKPEWASPKDQDVFFSDFSVAVLEKL